MVSVWPRQMRTQRLTQLLQASKTGLVKSILVGNQAWIEDMLVNLVIHKEVFEIINEKDSVKAAALAAQVVRDGRADILMKGGVVTSKFLQAALGSPGNLKGGLFSDVAVYEDVRSDVRLILVSDGGVNISPGIKQKLEIIRNAAAVSPSSGHREPESGLTVRV